jgi:hypothetical protein
METRPLQLVSRPCDKAEREMNDAFRAVSATSCLYGVKFGEQRNNNKKRLFQRKQPPGAGYGTKVPSRRTRQRNERTTMMIYMTLALMAGLISVMFMATAVSSIVNAVRENNAVRDARSRSAALQF